MLPRDRRFAASYRVDGRWPSKASSQTNKEEASYFFVELVAASLTHPQKKPVPMAICDVNISAARENLR